MSLIYDDKQVFEIVCSNISEALRIPLVKITPDSRVFIDLGAGSLDIIDIRFRLEHAFGFKVQDKEMVQSLGKDLSAAEIQETFTVAAIVRFISQRLHNDTL